MALEYSEKDILKALRRSELFGQFNETELAPLLEFSSVKRFHAGQTVLAEAERNDQVFVILNGCVSVFAGDEFILKYERQGDLVGEMSVITKSLTSASVVADTDTDIFAIPSEKVFESGQFEIKSLLYKIFLDILTKKLTMTTQRVIGFQETSQQLDIKKQELAESESSLQQKEVILQSVLGSMSDGVVVTDNAGKLLHINESFRSMVGDTEIPVDFADWPAKLGLYQANEETLYAAQDLPMVKILKGIEVDDEEIFVTNDKLGEGIWLQAGSRLLKNDEQEAALGAVVVFRDYTKKKKEEQALIQAKENAEAMAKAKSDFLAVMSHELRTPLNGIMGMTELLQTTSLTDDQKDCLDTIKTSGDNLLRIVRNILDYNNLESGAFKLKIEPFSIQDVFNEIVDNFALLASRKSINLTTSIAAELPEKIKADPRAIRQILLNLTDNAIKFSETGEVNLAAHLEGKGGDTLAIKFSVKDQGIGILETDKPKLFQPFSQIDSTYSRRFEGTGIGLSVCKKMIDLMKGNIWVESETGKGSTFIFTLQTPAVKPEATELQKDSREIDRDVIPLDQNFADHVNIKILVAEDNPMNQKLITKVLKKLGYSPELANNGLEAVEMTKKDQFDMILMDLQMPEMDGIEAARAIVSENQGAQKPKIIALTANVSEDVKETCMRAGMIDYMSKPLKIDKLAAILQKHA